MDVLTALSVGQDSVWVAGEPRLLLRRQGFVARNNVLFIFYFLSASRLDVATLRSTDHLTLLPSWGRVTAARLETNATMKLVIGTLQGF